MNIFPSAELVPLRAWRTRSTGSRSYLGCISARSRPCLGYIYPQHGQQVLEGEDHRVGAGDLEGDGGLEAIHPLVNRRVARVEDAPEEQVLEIPNLTVSHAPVETVVEDAPAKNGVRAREFWVDDAVRVGVLPHDRDMDEAQDPVPEVPVDLSVSRY